MKFTKKNRHAYLTMCINTSCQYYGRPVACALTSCTTCYGPTESYYPMSRLGRLINNLKMKFRR